MTDFHWSNYSEGFDVKELFSCLKREGFPAAKHYTDDGYVIKAMQEYDVFLSCTENGSLLHSIITCDYLTAYMDYLKFIMEVTA